jgi:uncharacterized protein YpuA (DUF1002 family)
MLNGEKSPKIKNANKKSSAKTDMYGTSREKSRNDILESWRTSGQFTLPDIRDIERVCREYLDVYNYNELMDENINSFHDLIYSNKTSVNMN